MKLIGKKENIFGDNIAFVEHYDFSKANMNEENRILAVTQIASICYNNPKNVGSESLYNRLMTEAHSLPSSSAEFVPILFNYEWICNYIANYSDVFIDKTNILKYGEIITHNGEEYLLTNFRALVYDVEKIGLNKEILKQYNTEEECEIIKQHFKVFKYKVDLPTRSQMVRHRADIQELSRRYVSGKRKEFEFYVSDKMKDIESEQQVFYFNITPFGEQELDFNHYLDTETLINLCINHYNQALEQGVKPEEARRILPQACYTELWMAFQPKYLENFFNLRLDSHSQKEIRSVTEAMKELIQ